MTYVEDERILSSVSIKTDDNDRQIQTVKYKCGCWSQWGENLHGRFVSFRTGYWCPIHDAEA